MSAGLNIGPGNTLTQKAWRSLLCNEAERQAHMMSFVGTEEDSAIVLHDDLTKNKGDTLQIRFAPMDGDTHQGFGEGETVRGNELSPTLQSDSLRIGWLSEAYADQNPMSQQRISVALKKLALHDLSIWWARKWEVSILNQLAGYTPANTDDATGLYKLSGMNIVTAPDTAHQTFATGAADETVGADTTATMTLDLIDEQVLQASLKTTSQRPIAKCSDGYYHLVIHPYQAYQLRQNTTSGQWADVQRAVLEGGASFDKSPFAKGWIGVWNETKIHVSAYVPNGVNSSTGAAETNVRRAVFMGAHAGDIAFGGDFGSGDHLSWIESVDNYTDYGVLAGTIWGFKTAIYDSENYACRVISTYSAG